MLRQHRLVGLQELGKADTAAAGTSDATFLDCCGFSCFEDVLDDQQVLLSEWTFKTRQQLASCCCCLCSSCRAAVYQILNIITTTHPPGSEG